MERQQFRDFFGATFIELLERISDGIVVRGTVRTQWHGECSYCLTDLDQPIELHVDELFEPEPVEGRLRSVQDEVRRTFGDDYGPSGACGVTTPRRTSCVAG